MCSHAGAASWFSYEEPHGQVAQQSPVCTWGVILTYNLFLLHLLLLNLLYIILHDVMIMQDFLILVDHPLAGSDSGF